MVLVQNFFEGILIFPFRKSMVTSKKIYFCWRAQNFELSMLPVFCLCSDMIYRDWIKNPCTWPFHASCSKQCLNGQKWPLKWSKMSLGPKMDQPLSFSFSCDNRLNVESFDNLFFASLHSESIARILEFNSPISDWRRDISSSFAWRRFPRSSDAKIKMSLRTLTRAPNTRALYFYLYFGQGWGISFLYPVKIKRQWR